MKILVVDDAHDFRRYLRALLEDFAFEVIEAEDGHQAIQRFKDDQPDIIIMDCFMPHLNGMQATEAIKSMSADEWVPIVLVTSFDSQDIIQQSIACGADEFLTKPIKPAMLEFKLQGLMKGIEAWRLLLKQKRELAKYQYAMEDEKRIAQHLMQAFANNKGLSDSFIKWWIRPADVLSGDVIAAARTPLGDLHILLADGTGHGLNAALSAILLPRIFYAMTAHGYRIDSIAEEMNDRTKEFVPIDRFFATTLLSLSSGGVLEVWNAGNPAPVLIDEDGHFLHEFPSKHLPLGVLRHQPIDRQLDRFICPIGSQLLVMSDGYIEARDIDEREYGIEAVKHSLINSDKNKRLELLQNKIYAHLGQSVAHDDISILLLDINEVEHKAQNQPDTFDLIKQPESETLWNFQLTFNGKKLAKMSKDAIPLIMKMIEAMGRVNSDKLGVLFLTISELFNNALDHGLLKLESSIKNASGGFQKYLELRDEKLKQLNNSASISIEVEMNSHSTMFISVSDSGEGFDHQKFISLRGQNQSDEHLKYHGRGIALIFGLGVKLEFRGAGNEVLAYFSTL